MLPTEKDRTIVNNLCLLEGKERSVASMRGKDVFAFGHGFTIVGRMD
jgi:hypothetical protein